MKKLELKLQKEILLLENEGLIKRYLKNKDNFELFCDGHFWKPVCDGATLDYQKIIDIVKITWVDDNLELCKYKNYNSNGTGSLSNPMDSLISAIENYGFGWENNPLGEYRCISGPNGKLKNSCIDICQGSCWDVDHDEWESLQDKTFDPNITLILEKL